MRGVAWALGGAWTERKCLGKLFLAEEGEQEWRDPTDGFACASPSPPLHVPWGAALSAPRAPGSEAGQHGCLTLDSPACLLGTLVLDAGVSEACLQHAVGPGV